MRVPLLQIDAFADRLLEGNPAAVMPLPRWLDDAILQWIAAENNLSETAFVVAGAPSDAASLQSDRGEPLYHLRWFTPTVEVDLCGHATLATAAYLFEDVHPDATRVWFWTRSGWLSAARDGDGYTLDFPSEPPVPIGVDPALERALGVPVVAAFQATDLVCLVDGAEIGSRRHPGSCRDRCVRRPRRHRHRRRNWHSVRLRFPLLRSASRDRRGSGDRVRSLADRAAVGRAAWPNEARGAAALGTWRHGALPSRRRADVLDRLLRALPSRNGDDSRDLARRDPGVERRSLLARSGILAVVGADCGVGGLSNHWHAWTRPPRGRARCGGMVTGARDRLNSCGPWAEPDEPVSDLGVDDPIRITPLRPTLDA